VGLERPRAPDPPQGLQAVDPRTWVIVWRRVQADPSVKNVGYVLASWADYDTGARIFPGTRKLMLATGIKGDHTVRNALRQIREWRLAWRYLEGSRAPFVTTAQGEKKRPADEYRLTFPDDPAGIPMLSPDWETGELSLWAILWTTIGHRS
jgi:hypothetical protein